MTEPAEETPLSLSKKLSELLESQAEISAARAELEAKMDQLDGQEDEVIQLVRDVQDQLMAVLKANKRRARKRPTAARKSTASSRKDGKSTTQVIVEFFEGNGNVPTSSADIKKALDLSWSDMGSLSHMHKRGALLRQPDGKSPGKRVKYSYWLATSTS